MAVRLLFVFLCGAFVDRYIAPRLSRALRAFVEEASLRAAIEAFLGEMLVGIDLELATAPVRELARLAATTLTSPASALATLARSGALALALVAAALTSAAQWVCAREQRAHAVARARLAHWTGDTSAGASRGRAGGRRAPPPKPLRLRRYDLLRRAHASLSLIHISEPTRPY